ncbi:MAG: hypothetical protein HY717_20785 [Planctomycetes bacterium]|nr:hypothetical protein [Planctomycetota bacterium]
MSLLQDLRKHIEKVDALAKDLQIPDFPKGKEWFNSPPLSFKKELLGKITILDFWTYCCINCMHVLPELAALEEKYAGYPVAFIGVHSAKFENERVSENIRQAVLRYEIGHPVVNDDQMEMWRGIGVRSWPTLVVVGPRPNLLLMVSGEGNKEVIEACIQAALQFYPAEAFRHEPVPVALEKDKQVIHSPLRFPGKLAVDPAGQRLFISDSNHNRIVITDLEGNFREAAGTGRRGLRDGPFHQAAFNRPQGLAFSDPHLYVADAENHALRRVDLKAKTVTTLAGNGFQGRDYQGGGIGAGQLLSTPWDVAVYEGKVFIAMAGSHQIWTYDPAAGACSAYSGSGAEQNLNSRRRELAAWAQPSGLSTGKGQLFVADSESSAVRSIDLASGATRTIAGGDDENPMNLFAFGDRDGKRDGARLQHPLGVLWVERLRRVVVADTYNHRLKLVDPESDAVESWAGSGKAGLKDGQGLEAQFSEPAGLALSPDGQSLFVADANNHAIRTVDLGSRQVRTLALKGIPEAQGAFPPRSQRLADWPDLPTFRSNPMKLAPGSQGKLLLRLKLPEGFHYTEGAGSRWQILAGDGLPVSIAEESASGPIEKAGDLAIPLTSVKEKASGMLRLEALAYFCKDQGPCRLGAVLFEVPIEVNEPGKDAVELEHTFGDQGRSFGKAVQADGKR